jgi:hypothetical protein
MRRWLASMIATPDPDPYVTMTERIIKAARDRAEQVCEAAVQTGTCGVLVVTYPDGTEAMAVSALVPYGVMARVPAEGLDNWLANGCPV